MIDLVMGEEYTSDMFFNGIASAVVTDIDRFDQTIDLDYYDEEGYHIKSGEAKMNGAFAMSLKKKLKCKCKNNNPDDFYLVWNPEAASSPTVRYCCMEKAGEGVEYLMNKGIKEVFIVGTYAKATKKVDYELKDI